MILSLKAHLLFRLKKVSYITICVNPRRERKKSMDYDYKTGFVTYPDAEPGSPEAKAPYVDHGTGRIDPRRYYSAEEAELEWTHMWTKSWSFARSEEHTSELQSLMRISYAVFCLKKKINKIHYNVITCK